MSDTLVKGSCLCGQVTYQATGHMGLFQYCHCSRCRKFTGSAHASNLFVEPKDFRWLSGEGQVGRYEPEGAKHFATAFCKSCGSSLPWLAKSGKVVVIPSGSLDTDPAIRPQWNIFCDSKAEWYVDPAELPQYQQLPPRKSK